MIYLLNGQESERLHFRAVRESDFPVWLEFFRHPETHRHWTLSVLSPEEQCKAWYANQFGRYGNARGGMNALIDKQSHQLIGHAGLLVQTVDDEQELEIAYSILPAFWNQGYASEAAIHCRELAFERALSRSLISIISITNSSSEKVARKNGMIVDKKTTYRGNKVNIWRVTAQGQLPRA